jgi:hypothetical protein
VLVNNKRVLNIRASEVFFMVWAWIWIYKYKFYK